MITYLWNVGDFMRRLKLPAPFGSLSRAQLRLLRLELRGSEVVRDWVARPPDKWDRHVKAEVARKNASTQALRDAIAVREMVFRAIADLRQAFIRVFREAGEHEMELIITGSLTREERPPWRSGRSRCAPSSLVSSSGWRKEFWRACSWKTAWRLDEPGIHCEQGREAKPGFTQIPVLSVCECPRS